MPREQKTSKRRVSKDAVLIPSSALSLTILLLWKDRASVICLSSEPSSTYRDECIGLRVSWSDGTLGDAVDTIVLSTANN